MNQDDARRWADEIEKIEMDMAAGMRRSGNWDEFLLRYQDHAPMRLRLEATCSWVMICLGEGRKPW